MNVHGVSHVRQTELQLINWYLILLLFRLEQYKSPGIDQIPPELIHNKNELP